VTPPPAPKNIFVGTGEAQPAPENYFQNYSLNSFNSEKIAKYRKRKICTLNTRKKM
jgi:hypothetical protein